jgi:hypothetical protein
MLAVLESSRGGTRSPGALEPSPPARQPPSRTASSRRLLALGYERVQLVSRSRASPISSRAATAK